MGTTGVILETKLLPNYSNPFNPDTWIPYQLAQDAIVRITIYAANGALVRELNLGHQKAGDYSSRSKAAFWDGRNDAGERVSSGVYFCRFAAGDFTAMHKMTMLQ